MLILGIETSCDETALALVSDGVHIHGNLVVSQVELHSKFRGIIPELASRKHVEIIIPALEQMLSETCTRLSDIDAVAVTHGPGLLGSLLIGVSTAAGIALGQRIPLIPVNHLQAHLYAASLGQHSFHGPAVGLVISGGHTDLVYMHNLLSYELLGATRDDAVGEAFDKVARILDLGYPGGPAIERIACSGNAVNVALPQPKFKEATLDFSLSGLKTAVLYRVKQLKKEGKSIPVPDIAASFQLEVARMLSKRLQQATKQTEATKILIGGGVAANRFIREFLLSSLGPAISIQIAAPHLCTDNAVMVAGLAYHRLNAGKGSTLSLEAVPNLSISSKEH